jgi:hypothetical protein
VTIGRVTRAAVGLGLVLLGSLVWNSRVPNFKDELVMSRLANRLKEVQAGSSVDISAECERQTVGNGWALFVLDANLISDNQFRSYFETASEEMGVWVTFDSGQLRLGLGSGPSSSESNRSYPIRTVRRSERATIFIAVSRDETRVVMNVRDFRVTWPADFVTGWSCEYVQFGDEANLLSEGAGCRGCNISLRYATGENYEELTAVLDEVSNVSEFNQRRWLGSGATLLGVFVVFVPLSRRRPNQSSNNKAHQP